MSYVGFFIFALIIGLICYNLWQIIRAGADLNKAKLQKPCPLCGSTMHYKNKLKVITYSDQSKEVDILAWWCEGCGDGILDHNALEIQENAWMELKKRSCK